MATVHSIITQVHCIVQTADLHLNSFHPILSLHSWLWQKGKIAYTQCACIHTLLIPALKWQYKPVVCERTYPAQISDYVPSTCQTNENNKSSRTETNNGNRNHSLPWHVFLPLLHGTSVLLQLQLYKYILGWWFHQAVFLRSRFCSNLKYDSIAVFSIYIMIPLATIIWTGHLMHSTNIWHGPSPYIRMYIVDTTKRT